MRANGDPAGPRGPRHLLRHLQVHRLLLAHRVHQHHDPLLHQLELHRPPVLLRRRPALRQLRLLLRQDRGLRQAASPRAADLEPRQLHAPVLPHHAHHHHRHFRAHCLLCRPAAVLVPAVRP